MPSSTPSDDRYPKNTSTPYYIGLMSGTSLDGVDAVIASFNPSIKILHSHYHAFDAQMQRALNSLCFKDNVSLKALGELDTQLGFLFADCVDKLLNEAGINKKEVHAIGCHGQTVYHSPTPPWPFTIQIGDPNHIAKLTGITTVADFRRKDIAAGGQGAPLVPPFHKALFQHQSEERVVLNLGGIANITVLPSLSSNASVIGYDTGPANTLLDAWIYKNLGRKYDPSGEWASTGTCNQALLMHFLDDPYFKLDAPKSTGKEYFDLSWIQKKLLSFTDERTTIESSDVQATLANLTAHSVVDSINHQKINLDRLLVCGGGIYNEVVIKRLKELLDCPVESTLLHGLDPDWVEAAAFAWLAKKRMDSTTGNLPGVTGAKTAEVLGAIYSG